MAFNAVTVLFRLLSEDNVSGMLRKVRGEVAGVEKEVGKASTSFQKLQRDIHKLGMENPKVTPVDIKEIEKERKEVEKLQKQLKMLGYSDKDVQKISNEMKQAGNQIDKTTTRVDRLKGALKGAGVAAGAALAGMSLMSGMFIQQSVQAAATMEKQNMVTGGALGMNAQQSLDAAPQFMNILQSVQGRTGRGTEELRNIMPSVLMASGGDNARTQAGMEAVSALTYIKPNADLGAVATMYNKMVTSGSPMALGNFGISLTDMGLSTKQFKEMSQDARQSAIDSAIAAKAQNVNANMVHTAAGQMAIFTGKWTVFQAKLGEGFIPLLIWAMDTLTPFMDFIIGHYIQIGDAKIQLTSVLALVLGLITVAGLAAGPLVAISILFPGAIGKMWGMVLGTSAAGDSASAAAIAEGRLATGQGAVATTAWLAYAGLVAVLGVLALIYYEADKHKNDPPVTSPTESPLQKLVPSGVEIIPGTGITTGRFQYSSDPRELPDSEAPYGSKWIRNQMDKGWFGNQMNDNGKTETPLTWLGEQLGKLLPGTASAANVQSNDPNRPRGNVTGGGPMTDPQMGKDIADLFDMSRFKWILPSISKAIYDTMVGSPQEMAKWGILIIGSLAQGMMQGMPSIDGALNWLRSKLPNSPPKSGPLSHVTEATWFNWTSSLANAGMRGLSSFNLDHISADPTSIKPAISPSAVHTHYHAPITIDASHMSKHELMALVTEANEGALKPKGLPSQKSTTGKKDTDTAKVAKQPVTKKTTGGV